MVLHKIFGYVFSIVLLARVCLAEPIGSFHVEGNQRIESETILNYLTLKKGMSPSETDLDTNLKILYS